MKVGDIVIHPGMPELGAGIILRIEDNKAHIRWEDASARPIWLLPYLQLAPAGTPPPPERPVPPKILRGPSNKSRPTSPSFTALVSRFTQKYPGLCDDQQFIKDEYGYKAEASAHFQSVVASAQLDSLIEQKSFSEAVSLILDMVGPKHSNLLYPRVGGEYYHLRKILDDHKRHERFTFAFCALLDTTADLQKAFDSYVDLLGEIDADVWPNATLPLFLLDYENHIFVKPASFNMVASSCDYHIDCRRPPTWEKYSRILEFASYLKTKLHQETVIVTKNMIDLQSFIYVCHKYP
jgi:hypothetical protein